LYRTNSKAFLISYGSTGGGFLLNREAAYDVNQHAMERNLKLVDCARGASAAKTSPATSACLAGEPLADAILERLREKRGVRIAIHPAAGSSAKSWPMKHWKRLLDYLGSRAPVQILWIGDENAGSISEQLESMMTETAGVCYVNLCGKIKLSQLGSLLKQCAILISPDSGPVHIAAAQKTPTLVIYSGTNRAEEWGPMNTNAKLVSHPVPCSPCQQRECPLAHHACMEGLEPERVIQEFQRMMP
jgi:ADP-heptose:LPS heptosyltransferase